MNGSTCLWIVECLNPFGDGETVWAFTSKRDADTHAKSLRAEAVDAGALDTAYVIYPRTVTFAIYGGAQ